METQIILSFLLSDFEQDPEEITNLLGIAPSLTWKKGDLIHPKAHIIRKFNGWEFKPDLSEDEQLEVKLFSLVDELNKAWKTLIELTNNNCYAEISIVINVYGDNIPAINFEPEIIRKIAEINASIDIDLYILDTK
jgi:hypothetical protein